MEHPHILDQLLRSAIREGHRLLHQQVAGSVSGIQYVWKYAGIPQVYTQVKQTVPINADYIPHILKPFCWGFPSCHPAILPSCHPALGCLRQGSFQWNEPCCTAPAGIPGWCGEVTPSHMGTVYGTIGLPHYWYYWYLHDKKTTGLWCPMFASLFPISFLGMFMIFIHIYPTWRSQH